MAKPIRHTPEMMSEYIKKGYWEGISLSDVWARNAKDFPKREAIADSNTRLTWAESEKWIDRIALGFLEQGLKRDDLVALELMNSVELCLGRVACEKAGLLCLPILRTYRGRDMEYILKYTGAKAVVIPDKFRDLDYVEMIESLRPNLPELSKVFVIGKNVPEWAISFSEMIKQPLEKKHPKDYLEGIHFKPTEISLINHTTGTTGFPKFAEYTSGARLACGRGMAEVLHLTPDDILAALSPAGAGPNIPVYFAAPVAASKVIFQEKYEAEAALKLLEKERVTVACGVPAQMAQILQHPNLGKYDLSSVRVWWCTSAPLAYQLGKEFEEKTRIKVLNAYGGVDFGGSLVAGIEDPVDTRLLTVGKPRAWAEIKLVDDSGKEVTGGEVGELWGRGPACCSGLFRNSEETWQSWTQDGWFKTGDLCTFDENGNVVVVGRSKDIIIRGGWNIYPKEIENILLTHSKVQDVAIIGMPDTVMGEKPCVYIVTKPGQQISLEEVNLLLKEKGLEPYKLPERLEILLELPMVAEGQKVDKKLLRQKITEKLKAEG